jgi:hypothetical protein
MCEPHYRHPCWMPAKSMGLLLLRCMMQLVCWQSARNTIAAKGQRLCIFAEKPASFLPPCYAVLYLDSNCIVNSILEPSNQDTLFRPLGWNRDGLAGLPVSSDYNLKLLNARSCLAADVQPRHLLIYIAKQTGCRVSADGI